MLMRSQATTLLQIFCELLLYSQVIFKSMGVANDILSNGTLSVNESSFNGILVYIVCKELECNTIFRNYKE